MSATVDLNPARHALLLYQQYRQKHPLPPGWTERILQAPAEERIDILLKNDTYSCNLRFGNENKCDPAVGGCAEMFVIRRDREFPTTEESLAVTRLLLGDDIQPWVDGSFVFEDYDPERRFQIIWPAINPKDNPGKHFGQEVCFRYPPEEASQSKVDPAHADVPGLDLSDDYVAVPLSVERIRQLEAWLQEKGLPPLEEIKTPQGDSCLAYSAEILDRFDRHHLVEPSEAEVDGQTSRKPGNQEMKTMLYRFSKG